jgi:hypothetical protein
MKKHATYDDTVKRAFVEDFLFGRGRKQKLTIAEFARQRRVNSTCLSKWVTCYRTLQVDKNKPINPKTPIHLVGIDIRSPKSFAGASSMTHKNGVPHPSTKVLSDIVKIYREAFQAGTQKVMMTYQVKSLF